jgi:hypothetical protein
MNKIPKEGTIFTKDKSKKLDFMQTYKRFRLKIYTLTNKYGYKFDNSKVLKRDNFLEYIEKEQYEI